MRETSTISVMGSPASCRRTLPCPEAGASELRGSWRERGRGAMRARDAALAPRLLIPTRVKADSFQGFQNGASSESCPSASATGPMHDAQCGLVLGGYWGQQCDIQAAPAHTRGPGIVTPAQNQLVVF